LKKTVYRTSGASASKRHTQPRNDDTFLKLFLSNDTRGRYLDPNGMLIFL
jgi:hypothetical protein